jgi:hypothetical protein
MPTIAEVREKFPQYNDMSDEQLAGALHQRFYSDMDPQAFAEKIGLKPDKYRQAAIEERAALDPPDAGITRRLVHGATLGADNTLLAAAMTPLEMVKRGTINPAEGYSYAKAREDLALEEARKNTGLAGSAAEILGGGFAGGGLASGGLTATRFLNSAAPSLLGRTAAMGADAAALGGVAGFNEGNSLSERAAGAGQGALLGGLIGGALPVVGTVGKAVASPFISNIMARYNPRGFAEGQVARGVMESGRSTADIADDVVMAANEGQGMFTVADAMGNAGQRLLSTTARAPGAGRTQVADFPRVDTSAAGNACRVWRRPCTIPGSDQHSERVPPRRCRADHGRCGEVSNDHGSQSGNPDADGTAGAASRQRQKRPAILL